jgi:hypothetical protein
VTGVMSSFVVGGVLAVGAVEGARRGLGRSFLTQLAWLGSGALLVASPWIIDTFLAWQVRGSTPPIHFKWNDKLGVLLLLEFGDFGMLRRVLIRLGPSWSVVAWLSPLTAGSIRLAKRPRDPLLVAYVCTAIIVPMLAIYSPLTPILMRVVGAAYVSRFVEVLPLAALVGLGFGALRTVMVPSVVGRISIGTAVMLAVATMLHGLEPSRKPRLVIPRHLIHRPDLATLEPIIGGKVVLSDPQTAYVLPHFTGAFLAQNMQKHLNPWVCDPRRVKGARSILAGRATIEETLAYCQQFDVEFLLLRKDRHKSVSDELAASGQFRSMETESSYLLFERSAQ